MGLLGRWRLRRAARRYAASLPSALVAAFGASERYTPEQIRVAVAQCELDAQFIVFAYTAFLPETQFTALQADMPKPIAYPQARSLLGRYRPSRPWSASGTPGGEHTSGLSTGGGTPD
jgi:hypothetical protein